MITLKTLAKATRQQIFDQVARHLLKQKVRAYDEENEKCQYRTSNGLMCAAGCLIADDEYDPQYDRTGSWSAVVDRHQEVPEAHRGLIDALQTLHDTRPGCWPYNDIDSPEGVIDYAVRLKYFAERHQLKFDLEALQA